MKHIFCKSLQKGKEKIVWAIICEGPFYVNKLQVGPLSLTKMKTGTDLLVVLTCRNSLSSAVVGGDRLSKLKLKQGLGDSWKDDLGDSRVKEAGDKLDVGVQTSR